MEGLTEKEYEEYFELRKKVYLGEERRTEVVEGFSQLQKKVDTIGRFLREKTGVNNRYYVFPKEAYVFPDSFIANQR